jgi:hypothetical protein
VICQTGHSRSSFERYGLNVQCGTCPWRIVANSEVTPFWSYFLVAGDPDGTPEFAFQALDSRLGDLA